MNRKYIFDNIVLLSNWLTNSMLLLRCPNPLDPAQHQAVLFDPQPPTPRGHTRRFTISTFQFLPDGQFTDPDEEVRISRVPLSSVNNGGGILNTSNCINHVFHYFSSCFIRTWHLKFVAT